MITTKLSDGMVVLAHAPFSPKTFANESAAKGEIRRVRMLDDVSFYCSLDRRGKRDRVPAGTSLLPHKARGGNFWYVRVEEAV